MEAMTDKRPMAGAHDAAAALANALQAARAAIGSEHDVERLHVRFEAMLSSAARPEAPALATTQRREVLGTKGWTLLLGAALAVGALLYAASRSGVSTRSAVDRAAASAEHAARTSRADPAGPDALSVVGTSPALPATVASPMAPAVGAGTARAARLEATTRRVPRPVSAAKAPTPPAVRWQVDPDAEIALVARAQDVLARQPIEALALLTEHERLFPHGVLTQERDTLRIDAERALGQQARAREHARAFVAQFPQSPQARALKQWLATSETGGAVHKPEPAPVLTR
jgi:hypothetical protein